MESEPSIFLPLSRVFLFRWTSVFLSRSTSSRGWWRPGSRRWEEWRSEGTSDASTPNLARISVTNQCLLGLTRSLPNLRRLLIEFVVHGDAGDDASPFALDGTLPELRRLLTQFGSTLTHLNLTEKNFDDTRELYDAPSLPLHSLIACPSLRILAVDGLRLEPLLLARQPYPSLEQLEIGVSDLSARNEDELSFGCGWFDPGSSTRDGALLRELVESFERSRFTRLRRVRLTCADWRFEKHRRMRGLKEKVRALRLMGIELVDFEGRVWSEQG